MIDGVRAVLLQVPDVGVASVWYARALEAQPFESQPGTFTFHLGGTRLVLRSAGTGVPDSDPPPAGVPANPAATAARLFFLSSDALDADARFAAALRVRRIRRADHHRLGRTRARIVVFNRP